MLGLAGRGAQADGPLNRATGAGWVKARTNHDYADAHSKQIGVTLLLLENTGAIGPELDRILQSLGRLSTAPGAQDSTVYGLSRASPRSFYPHHTAAISAAVVFADANTVLNAASYLSFTLLNPGPNG